MPGVKIRTGFFRMHSGLTFSPSFWALRPFLSGVTFCLWLCLGGAAQAAETGNAGPPAAYAGAGNAAAPGVGNATGAADMTDPDAAPLPDIEWTTVKPGLELGLASLPLSAAAGSEDRFVVLRIDPKAFNFSLCMASDAGGARSLKDWAESHHLLAGINASMYLPDNLTSTGLLRGPQHVNNARAGSRLGAFFVAAPTGKKLPAADILERGAKGLDERLARYGYVAQNYRLVSGSGDILWPAGGPAHSIAVVSKDAKGNILFILSQTPLTPHTFARYVRAFPLDAAPVMYVEGGGPAGLFLYEEGGADAKRPGAVSYAVAGGVVHVWKGRQGVLNTKGNPAALLPNIIGVGARE